MTATKSTSYYMGSLDGLRLMSFLIIFIHHMPEGAAIQVFAERGKIAVELFFVISAYLLFRLLEAEDQKKGQIDVRNFFVRRALRIYPLLVVYYLLTFVAQAGFLDPRAWVRLFTSLANVDNLVVWFWGYNFTVPAVGHLWTLSFEFQVYLLLPLAFMAWRRWGTRRFLWGLLAFEVVAFTCRWWAIHSGVQADPSVYVTPYLRPESILLGLALAVVKPTWKPRWSILAAVVAMAIYLSLPLGDELVRYFPAAVVVTGLMDGGLRAGPLRAFLAWHPIRSLGIISYGLYVFHIAAIWTVVTLLHLPSLAFLWHGPVIVVLSLSLTILAAAASYRWIERPFLRLKLRYTAIDGRGPEGQPLVEGPEAQPPEALEPQRPQA